jgi:hypothetical protein
MSFSISNLTTLWSRALLGKLTQLVNTFPAF